MMSGAIIANSVLLLLIHNVGLAHCRCTRKLGFYSGLMFVWTVFLFLPMGLFMFLGRWVAGQLESTMLSTAATAIGLLVGFGAPAVATAGLIWLEMRSAIVLRWLLVGTAGCMLRLIMHDEQILFEHQTVHTQLGGSSLLILSAIWHGCFVVGIIHEVLAHPWQKLKPNCCKNCGYSLEGLSTNTCPECGRNIAERQSGD